MGKIITIRRGYNIRLLGAAEKSISPIPVSDVIAIKPSDFLHVKPKISVEPGDMIQAGECLFTDKNRPELAFTSPVSGEIAEIVLGEKRRIQEIRILPDKHETRYLTFPKSDPATLTKEDLIKRLLESGCWNYIRQRPYDLIANPSNKPKAIFISLFDTSPLAPDINFVINQERDHFETGLRALQTLSSNQVHLGVPAAAKTRGTPSTYPGIADDHIHFFTGPHPAGNVGIQIHHVNPIQKDEVVWYVHPQDVMIIGRLFDEGRYRADRIIALTGSSMNHPQYARAMTGQPLKDILQFAMPDGQARLIQGNVLFGQTSSMQDYLSFYTNQITAIPEGNEPEFLGWLLPGFKKLSLSRTFFSWLAPNRSYALDTNLHGEERAFVMTGQYDKVLPMNIFPVFLLKAILAKDIEKMEALGIYEVSEEDFALCEFVCTSKIAVQQIIREGLNLMLEES